MTTIILKNDKSASLVQQGSSWRKQVFVPVTDQNEVVDVDKDGRLNVDAISESRQFVQRVVNVGTALAVNKLVARSTWNVANGASQVVLASSATPLYADGFLLRALGDGTVTPTVDHMCTMGLMQNVNTLSASVGDPVYLGTAGDFTFVAPANRQRIGIVINSAVSGSIWFDLFSAVDTPVGLFDWTPFTTYRQYDTVFRNGRTLRAVAAFTSGASFDIANWEDCTATRTIDIFDHGATGDGVADDSPAMVAAIADAVARGINVVTLGPPGGSNKFLFSSSVDLPDGAAGNDPFFIVEGNGSQVIAASAAVTCFQKLITDITGSESYDEYVPTLRNMKIAAASAGDGKGIVIHKSSGVQIENVELADLDESITLLACPNPSLRNIDIVHCENGPRFLGAENRVTAGTVTNGNCDLVRCDQVRVECDSVTQVGFFEETAGNVLFTQCSVSGSDVDKAWVFSDIGDGGGVNPARNILVKDCLCDITGSNPLTVIDSTSRQSTVVIDNLQFRALPADSTFLDATGSEQSQFIWQRTHGFAGAAAIGSTAPWFVPDIDVDPTKRNGWTFRDNHLPDGATFHDLSRWAGGVLPSAFIEKTWIEDDDRYEIYPPNTPGFAISDEGSAGVSLAVDFDIEDWIQYDVVQDVTSVTISGGQVNKIHELRFRQDGTGLWFVDMAGTFANDPRPIVNMLPNQETILRLRLDGNGLYHLVD